MNGEMGAAAAEATAFAEKLRPLVRCPITMWDERLSTTAANRALRDAGQKMRKTRGIVDQVAAQMILQGYLDSRPSTPLASSGDDAEPLE
jgi:putative Holliday junction resolvase